MGLKNVYQYLAQDVSPGLGRSIALTGLIYVFPINILYYFVDALALELYVSLIARVSACTRFNEYLVLVSVSTRKHFSEYTYLNL